MIVFPDKIRDNKPKFARCPGSVRDNENLKVVNCAATTLGTRYSVSPSRAVHRLK